MELQPNKRIYQMLLLVVLWASCKPQELDLVSHYHGYSHALYERMDFDSTSGGFNYTEWDSTYADQIIVEKNTNLNEITFYVNEAQHLASGHVYRFSFALDQASYLHYYGDSSYEKFNLQSNQLVWNRYVKEGNDSNYVLKKIDFTGKN